MNKKVKLKGKERYEHLFVKMPIWKSLLIMAIPSMIIMLVNGAYFFSDSLLSINFAADSYTDIAAHNPALSTSDLVRLFMNGYSPINSVMIAFSILFAMGITTRVSINLGAQRHERAINTIKSGFTIGLIVSIVLIPVLIFSAKPWIASQYDHSIAKTVSDNAFDYAWIIIASFPMMMFNNVISSLMRTEARNKEMMVAMIAPIFINLLMDWVMMGPVGMGVEGGAWATFISTAMTSIILLVCIYIKRHHSLIIFKNLFTIKVKFIVLFGIFLVGITPFIRNMAMSITQTVQMSIINDVSSHVYSGQAANIMSGSQKALSAHILGMMQFNNHDDAWWAQQSPTAIIDALNTKEFAEQAKALTALQPQAAIPADIAHAFEANFMAKIITGAMPVFGLFFPVMFGFAQSAGPIASFNYGAKNLHRVKQTYFWTILYATIAGVLMYVLAAFALGGPLMDVLQVHGAAKDRAVIVLRLLMLTLPLFGLGVAAMVIFGSTDRLIQSLIASSMQGLIVFWPVIYSMRAIAINVEWEYAFWFFWPVSAFLTSVINTTMVLITLRHLERPGHKTIDERVENLYAWVKNKKMQARVKPQ